MVVALLLLTVVPMRGAAAALLPEPTLETRFEQLRDAVARMAADPERVGCLEYRYAYKYMRSLEEQLAKRNQAD